MQLRVVVDGPRDPRINMAIDEALLRTYRRPTLRIYAWLPTGVSLGRRQDYREINAVEAERRGFVVVRRPTGGAALIHKWGWEITYSIVLADHPLLDRDVRESAAIIAQGIVYALEELGVPSMVGGFEGVEGEAGLCYVRRGSSDVVVAGRKVSGSAQRRSGGRLLQHGTLLLRFDPEEWLAVIPVRGMTPGQLASRVAGVEDLTGARVEFDRAVDAIARGFTRALGLEGFEYSGLTPKELSVALHLFSSKYSRDEWNVGGVEEEV